MDGLGGALGGAGRGPGQHRAGQARRHGGALRRPLRGGAREDRPGPGGGDHRRRQGRVPGVGTEVAVDLGKWLTDLKALHEKARSGTLDPAEERGLPGAAGRARPRAARRAEPHPSAGPGPPPVAPGRPGAPGGARGSPGGRSG